MGVGVWGSGVVVWGLGFGVWIFLLMGLGSGLKTSCRRLDSDWQTVLSSRLLWRFDRSGSKGSGYRVEGLGSSEEKTHRLIELHCFIIH